MPSVIQLLPQRLANQIAAGEVVQRPASVAKELLENALDAGATRVELVVRDAGKALIQVVDNGKGMSPDDARLSFERHATSKLYAEADLYAIRTFGFRGEALASIASVAQVRLQTREPGSELGTLVEVHGGQFVQQAACQAPVGTSVAVQHLFYNVPARRKFLKSNPVETRHLLAEFYRVALAWPGKHFCFSHNGERVFDLPPTDLASRVLALHPHLQATDLVPVDEETTLLTVAGFVGSPESARRVRGDQYFFVNGRFIKDGYLHHAVLQAYNDLIEKETYPFYCLFLGLDPGQVDVNIHPTKTEVKFEDERSLYALLRSAVQAAVGRRYHVPEAPSATDLPFLRPAVPTGGGGMVTTDTHRPPSLRPEVWAQLYGQLVAPTTRTATPSGFPVQGTVADQFAQRRETGLVTLADDEGAEPLQLALAYVVVADAQGLWVIDQHAAHERIVYERALADGAGPERPSQQLLYPQTHALSPVGMSVLQPALEELRRQGLDLKPINPTTLLISGLPAELKRTDVGALLDHLVGELHQSEGVRTPADFFRTRVARAVARQAAVRPGQALSLAERRALVRDLKAAAEPAYAPDGRPTGFRIPLAEVQSRLGRS